MFLPRRNSLQHAHLGFKFRCKLSPLHRGIREHRFQIRIGYVGGSSLEAGFTVSARQDEIVQTVDEFFPVHSP